eukprot:GHVP01065841.1.p1 GENE.GHVP01065841.1~~GHVP01065841.1.p1  ORF type:complete len:111 (-),score=16.82 GHVP01065841.1:523-855(-)
MKTDLLKFKLRSLISRKEESKSGEKSEIYSASLSQKHSSLVDEINERKHFLRKIILLSTPKSNELKFLDKAIARHAWYQSQLKSIPLDGVWKYDRRIAALILLKNRRKKK